MTFDYSRDSPFIGSKFVPSYTTVGLSLWEDSNNNVYIQPIVSKNKGESRCAVTIPKEDIENLIIALKFIQNGNTEDNV